MAKGGSKSNTSSSSETTNYVDNSVTTVDAGALETARDIATRSLDAAEASGSRALNVASDAVADALGFGEGALDFGRSALTVADRAGERQSASLLDALGFGRSIFGGALDAISSGQSDALTFADRQNTRLADVLGSAGELVASAYESAYDTAGEVLREGQASVANTVSNLNAISRQAATSDGERMQAITKYALIAAAVMVAAFALKGSR